MGIWCVRISLTRQLAGVETTFLGQGFIGLQKSSSVGGQGWHSRRLLATETGGKHKTDNGYNRVATGNAVSTEKNTKEASKYTNSDKLKNEWKNMYSGNMKINNRDRYNSNRFSCFREHA